MPPSPFSRKRAARSLMTARSSCGMRAAGVPGRGENGKTCSCVSPQSSTKSSERMNIASVSVGKPAMIVGAEHHIGPQPAHLIAEGDRIRANLPALHALENEIITTCGTDANAASVAARWRRHQADRHRPPPNQWMTTVAALF